MFYLVIYNLKNIIFIYISILYFIFYAYNIVRKKRRRQLKLCTHSLSLSLFPLSLLLDVFFNFFLLKIYIFMSSTTRLQFHLLSNVFEFFE